MSQDVTQNEAETLIPIKLQSLEWVKLNCFEEAENGNTVFYWKSMSAYHQWLKNIDGYTPAIRESYVKLGVIYISDKDIKTYSWITEKILNKEIDAEYFI